MLAHGAGAAMDSPFMATLAEGLAAEGVGVARFEFPYMQARRRTGVRRPPDRVHVLIDRWRETIETLGGGSNLVIGGKSLGGRMASLIADEAGVRGLVCLGYPFHAPGRPAGERVRHLTRLRTPTLIIQGQRDPLGRPDEVETYGLSAATRVAWIADGDHSLKPRKASGRSEARNLAEAIGLTAAFVRGL